MFPGVCIAIPHRRDNGKQFSMHRSVLMEPRTLQYMAEAAHGELIGASDAVVRRVCTDSRAVESEDLFVALPGDRFDGHAFLADAVRAGIVGAVVDRAHVPKEKLSCACIAVDNTRSALGRMAARYRRDFDLPLVAVAGSNGKTTTKELIASVLRQRFRTLSSRASFNNDIGVPTTLLELNQDHEAAVLEFGTNHPGELAPLLALAQPGFGVLTSIGREHLEFFNDEQGVLQEEGYLAELVPATGKLFVNGDMAVLESIERRAAAPVVRVGFGAQNAWRASNFRMDETGSSFCVLGGVPGYDHEYRLRLLGRHQVINALFAIAVGAELGVSPEKVQAGLLNCPAPKMRLEFSVMQGVGLLDDSYNANADSMRAALETLRALPCRGRRAAVLGDMAELGNQAAAAHAETGRSAAELGIDYLLSVGEMAGVTVEAAHAAGLTRARKVQTAEAVVDLLGTWLRPGDILLIKASRAARLERVAEWLRQRWARSDADPSQGRKALDQG